MRTLEGLGYLNALPWEAMVGPLCWRVGRSEQAEPGLDSSSKVAQEQS